MISRIQNKQVRTVFYSVLIFFASFIAWPAFTLFKNAFEYKHAFSFQNFNAVLGEGKLGTAFANSFRVSFISSLITTVLAFAVAYTVCFTNIPAWLKKTLRTLAVFPMLLPYAVNEARKNFTEQITNTIPGMVLGIAFLLTFRKTPIHNTLIIIVACNLIHFFATPFLMMKGALEKMNSSWETTAAVLGDNWIKTVTRIIAPNALPTLLEIFCYLFINGMVTVSAIVFIAGAKAMVITTKIQELQHFAKFNEIFILSIYILLTNLVLKGVKGIINMKILKRS